MKNHVLWKATSIVTGLLLSGLSFASEPEAVPGEYLVKLKTPVSQKSFSTLSTMLGGQVLRSIQGTNIVVLKRSVAEKSASVTKMLGQLPQVEIAEPNYIYRAFAKPNDPDMGKLWGLVNNGQNDSSNAAGVAGVDIDAERAWDLQTGSDKVVVAVIDTGLDYTHPDLAENSWTNEAEANGKAGVDDDKNGYIDDIHGYDFVNNDGDPMDDHGHGSHCAGTIGAKGNDGKGIVGVSWNVKIMGLKFLSASGSGSSEDAIKSIDYATKMGARVMSNSWGGGGYSELLKEAIVRSNDINSSFIAAAGNSSSNNDTDPSYPANYDVPNVVSVAAINNRGGLASFSSYGRRTVHVAAPGVNIHSSIPGGYDSWSGTSMATPHVSGVAALLAASNENMTGAEIKERLMTTTKPLSGLRSKVASGGMVNAYFALTNQQAPPDPNDPSQWTNTQSLSISTPHPYKDKANSEWEVRVAGATKMALFFDKFDTELNYDKVTLYDAAGKKLAEIHGGASGWSEVLNTDYVKIVFKSDDSISKYGFDLTKVSWK